MSRVINFTVCRGWTATFHFYTLTHVFRDVWGKPVWVMSIVIYGNFRWRKVVSKVTVIYCPREEENEISIVAKVLALTTSKLLLSLRNRTSPILLFWHEIWKKRCSEISILWGNLRSRSAFEIYANFKVDIACENQFLFYYFPNIVQKLYNFPSEQ